MFDIENAPSLSYIWSLKNEDYIPYDFVENDWYILCWAAKWLDDSRIYSSALPGFKQYKKDPTNDREVAQALWKLLDEADVAVAHNGVSFDMRKINARFIYHGIKPPSPYRMIDTLLVARRQFMFTSNRLGDLGKYLKIGKKEDTGGFSLWRGCMNGDRRAWKKMVKYCKGDITLLESVYKKLRPYIRRHPNMALFSDDNKVMCPKCGTEDLQFRGYSYTNASKFQRFVCNECGGWGRLKTNLLTKDKKLRVANA